MVPHKKLDAEKVFIAPLSDDSVEYLKNRNLSYYNEKFLRYYFRSHYPSNCILSGLEVIPSILQNLFRVNISKGVVIVDDTVINIIKDYGLSDNIVRHPSPVITIVNIYQDWTNKNRYLTPELQINYLINGQLYLPNVSNNINIDKGFLPLSAYSISHDGNVITNISDISDQSLFINNKIFTVNKYKYSSISSGSNTADIKKNIDTIQLTTQFIHNNELTISKIFDLNNLDQTYITILDSNQIDSSPILYNTKHFDIILPNKINWINYELKDLLVTGEFMRIEYFYE